MLVTPCTPFNTMTTHLLRDIRSPPKRRNNQPTFPRRKYMPQQTERIIQFLLLFNPDPGEIFMPNACWGGGLIDNGVHEGRVGFPVVARPIIAA